MITSSRLLQSCKILIFINAFFWLIAAFYFSFMKYPDNKDYLAIKLLLALEPIGYLVLLYAVVKKWRVIYVFGTLFTFVNMLLSITDQMGLYDVFSLSISLLLFLNLLVIRRQLFPKSFH